nr:hypothetical protein [uncultured Niameybacter sp.]
MRKSFTEGEKMSSLGRRCCVKAMKMKLLSLGIKGCFNQSGTATTRL